MRRQALKQGNFQVSKLTPEQRKMKRDDIKYQVEEMEGIYKDIFYQTRKIKGSNEYQKVKQRELNSMVQQLGLPGLFETFSQADKYWDDLRQVLASFEPKLENKDLPKEEFIDLMYETTQLNPHVVNSFFVNKFDIFLNEFLKKSMNITAYWISQE